MTLRLLEITNSEDDVLQSYRLLEKRIFSISHHSMPTLEEHACFLADSPYRFWFFIKLDETFAGTVYVQYDNSIGLYLQPSNLPHLTEILTKVTKYCDPLPAVPSVRRGQFFLNVPASDIELQEALIRIGAHEIQKSFVLPDLQSMR